MATERRALKMHPHLLWDVIHRQAGTLAKAILEGVMNSIDAGSTRCDVTIDRKSFSIADDGKGFKDEDEITNFFETFGFPHKAGDAKYGRFRMGRGQMFAFGRNEWNTNTFKMKVDLKPQELDATEGDGLGYDLSRLKTAVEGCSIKVALYDPITPSVLDTIVREISEYVRFYDIPVTLNGKVISTHPKDEKWDVETDDAYVKLRATGDLHVYNQGVLVCRYSNYKYGTGGVVASKTALDVNFARNDVQSTCKVWRRIAKHLDQNAAEKAKKRGPLSDGERGNLAMKLASGALNLHELEDARIVTDVTGSHHPFLRLLSLGNFQDSVAIANRGDRVSEMAHTRRLAFVVTPETAQNFGAETAQQLVDAVVRIAQANNHRPPRLKAVSRETFERTFDSRHTALTDKDLNADEKRALQVLKEANKVLWRHGRWYDSRSSSQTFEVGSRSSEARTIALGSSDTALAWTNGTTHIWVERRQLALLKDGAPGMTRLAGLLLHEYLHNEPDTGTHEHGVEFYERFHDLTIRTDAVGACANAMLKEMVQSLRRDGKKVASYYSRAEDLDARAADVGMSHDPAPSNDDAPDGAVAAASAPEGTVAFRRVDPDLAAALASPAEAATRQPSGRDAHGRWARPGDEGREFEPLPRLPGM